MATMKALVKARPEPGLWLQEVPVPEIGVNDVLIKIHRTAICGTDVHIYNWDKWAQRTIPVPMHVGHEFVGRVVKIGSNVHDITPAITQRFPYTEFEKGFEVMCSGQSGKVILHWFDD